MPIHIVQLGTPRTPHEGLRLGTVRRPPRGVPKAEFASRDYYDTWLPVLSPSAELVTEAKAAEDEKDWEAFRRKFKAEMNHPAPSQLLDLLAALSHQTSLTIGCYCKEERHCHRSVLRELLIARGAQVAALEEV
ncbi:MULTISPECIES: DUF488 domain-containing protein [unclassified Pseudomonas]|uniref:DUF488 domain-containing protein n=1 Tax=unclassified Pseudomonas TaxID=196821 RepID=UPI000CD220E7|nr:MULTISPECIES: DUF488 family protein [unclassified Pseudomonas]POA29947.1 DUF488 domain-containing protein [Pseudomonas sp. GW456-R21]POA64198.1 DUF488 domain-containing protein [Pseudomonas sp. GW460-R15]